MTIKNRLKEIIDWTDFGKVVEWIVFMAAVLFAIMDDYDAACFGMLAVIYLAITRDRW